MGVVQYQHSCSGSENNGGNLIALDKLLQALVPSLSIFLAGVSGSLLRPENTYQHHAISIESFQIEALAIRGFHDEIRILRIVRILDFPLENFLHSRFRWLIQQSELRDKALVGGHVMSCIPS